MTKVTKDLQVTIPKHIADQYGITPGADVEFVPAGNTIRLVPPGPRMSVPTLSVDPHARGRALSPVTNVSAETFRSG